jgi:hypothetical protein
MAAKKKLSEALQIVMDEALIEKIREYPALYNHCLPLVERKPHIIIKRWKQIIGELKDEHPNTPSWYFEITKLKTHFNNLKLQWKRSSEKTKSGQAANITTQYKYHDIMSFLKDVYTPIK